MPTTFNYYKNMPAHQLRGHSSLSKKPPFMVTFSTDCYLLLSRKEFDHNKLKIEGYFSLTHKAVIFAGNVSLSARKKLAGSKKAQTESFVLIGQLGKNISLSDDGTICASKLSAKELLDDAIRIIQYSSNYIICRNIIIECKPIKKIKDIYESYGFTDLQYDENDDLHTLYLRLENQITF